MNNWFYGDMTEQEIQQFEHNQREYARKMEDAKRFLKAKGNAKIPDPSIGESVEWNYKAYNGYQKSFGHEPLKNKRPILDLDTGIPEDFDRIIDLANHANLFCREVFEIEITAYESGLIACDAFKKWREEGNDHIDDCIVKFNRAVRLIKLSFNVTKAKIESTIETLEALQTEVPKDIKTAQYIINNFKKHQKNKALEEAILYIFPQIDNKKIISKICEKCLQ